MSKTTDHVIEVQNAEIEQELDQIMAEEAQRIIDADKYAYECYDEEPYDDDLHGQATWNREVFHAVFGGPI